MKKRVIIIGMLSISILLIVSLFHNHHSNYEDFLIENGFVRKTPDVHEYDGYYLPLSTDNSRFCSQKKSVAIFDLEPTTIDYYCEENINQGKYMGFNYDMENNKLSYKEGASVFSEELNLTNAEQQQYKKVFDTEFSEFNTKFVGKYDELNK